MGWGGQGNDLFPRNKTHFISWFCISSHREADYESSDCDCDPLLGRVLAPVGKEGEGGKRRKEGEGEWIGEEYILVRVAGNCQGSDSKHESGRCIGGRCRGGTGTEAAKLINRALSQRQPPPSSPSTLVTRGGQYVTRAPKMLQGAQHGSGNPQLFSDGPAI